MKYNECTTQDRRKKLPLEEGGKFFVIKNPLKATLHKTQVDGCLFDEQVEKCDWIVSYDVNGKHAHYVELKGSDISKACSQLKSTLDLTREIFSAHKKHCHIVCSRVPRGGPSSIEIMKKFRRKCGHSLTIKTFKHVITAGEY